MQIRRMAVALPFLWMVSVPGLMAVAHAGGQPAQMTASLASDAALAAIEACSAKGMAVSAAVVDAQGQLHILHRGGSASLESLATSQKRAQAVSKHAQGQYGERAVGGALLRVDKTVVGAIGVGGATSAVHDEACAVVGANRALEKHVASQHSTRAVTFSYGLGDWLMGMKLFYRS
ncbi:uncharacterized protein GlcG (DUF336 family) [Chitinivorax tropicus]|uniref:Uncharacterized protein GlcG (DUF336 family) n=1 Tax=Chitinivorax tropicus TaxID=714531 RepID=A0A840MZK4_9PROT|nr:heme-binding protein [Chitinivorax tropicus]MBB5020571.1 uncharacterized protein GlcG (DUF336 family) [Chitinivorax tropicus]